MSDPAPIRALVWDEKPPHAPKEIYPVGINGAIVEGLNKYGGGNIRATAANLSEPEQGIAEATLAETDVLLWWGHRYHRDVSDETVRRVVDRVHNHGMGFICLHSGHYSKTFQAILGCTGHLKGGWRENDPPEKEFIRVCAPWHPIARGIEDFTLDHEEMYGAPFEVPPPLEVIFQSHFPLDGKTFPTGLCWTVGKGKLASFASGPGKGAGEGFGIGRVFYFRPGHETIPTYYDVNVQKIITNGVLWCGGTGPE